MGYENLGVVFGPAFLQPLVEEIEHIATMKNRAAIVAFMIEHKDALFTPPAEEVGPSRLLSFEASRRQSIYATTGSNVHSSR